MKRFFILTIFATLSVDINKLVRGDAMHKIEYDKNNRVLITSLSGNIGIEQANQMLVDFKKAVNGLNTKETILVISPENISASFLVLPILQNFIMTVSQLKFKKIFLINSDKYAAIIKQSLSSYGLAESVRYASSIKEALNNR